jgi:hypothetical protein
VTSVMLSGGPASGLQALASAHAASAGTSRDIMSNS